MRPCKQCGADIRRRYSRFCDACLALHAIPKPKRKCEVCGVDLKTKQRFRCAEHQIKLGEYNPRAAIDDTESSAEVVRLYASGLNMSIVAKQAGLSRQRVHQILHKLGIAIRRRESRPHVEFDLLKAIDMRTAGATLAEMSKELGYHPVTISQKLKAFPTPNAREHRDGQRHCYRCHEWKPLDQFFKKGCICRPCNTIRMREYIGKNREAYNAKVRAYTKRRRDQAKSRTA
jgi:lambda repressor-like predicted transcriptional regulator